MSGASELVVRLLDYIEQVEKLKAKPAFTVPDAPFAEFKPSLEGLPGLCFNTADAEEDLWLRIARLQEIPPPALSATYEKWIVLSRGPEKLPTLRKEIAVPEVGGQTIAHVVNERPDVQAYFEWYLHKQWTPWADAERVRRKAIGIYNKLFAVHEAISSDGAETQLELVWGMAVATWNPSGSASRVRHPLIVQQCEITLNTKTLDLEVRPRDVEPKLEVDCYAAMQLPGVTHIEAYWKTWLSSAATSPNPFDASSYEPLARAAVGHLDPNGQYLAGGPEPSLAPSSSLRIEPTWVLFARKRSGDLFIEDVRRLKKAVADAEELPAVVCSFVEPGDSEVRVRPEVLFRGLSTSDGSSSARELYFPMPYNDEQVSIIQKLETNDGVVVQGPPGTGKTHTIANVICHYLAQGKRVLVTAKSESALTVLQEKLPEQIRPLSVALLSDERDGMKQFEHSISTIASSVSALNVPKTIEEITSHEAQLSHLHAKISHVDQAISEYASRHMRTYLFQGKEVGSEDIARAVVEQTSEHGWFNDLPEKPANDLGLSEALMQSLREARVQVGDLLDHLDLSFPPLTSIPSGADIAELHRFVSKAHSIEESIEANEFSEFVDSLPETMDKAESLASFLADRASLLAEISARQLAWSTDLIEKLGSLGVTDPLVISLLENSERMRTLGATRKELLALAVEVPQEASSNEDYAAAIDKIAAGKKPFSLPFGRAEARQLLEATRVSGHRVSDPESCAPVIQCLQWRRDASVALARWNAMADEFPIPRAAGLPEEAIKSIAGALPVLDQVRKLAFEYNGHLMSKLQAVFGPTAVRQYLANPDSLLVEIEARLDRHIERKRVSFALEKVSELTMHLEQFTAPVAATLRNLLTDSVGAKDCVEGDLSGQWSALRSELKVLEDAEPSFATITTVTTELVRCGAPQWAARLRAQPVGEQESLIPANWEAAWEWSLAVSLLREIDAHDKLRGWFTQRHELTATLAKTYQNLIAAKTWLGVYKNSPDFVRQALQSYLTSVHAMGAGTGVRAIRYRRTARLAMANAYRAVPCWVLPQWRVSETIPAEVGLFDLVVIDEASQSDIWALPALLRGKKLLIVGDHKQVSPSAVGLADARIADLSKRFLDEQPHGRHMTPEQSIYDLASVVFAGNSVMLKEHFRCVPAIIEYSNREFYGGDIKPLRLPNAAERLDPPLIDVFVKGGYREGDVNKAEALAIVDEIKRIIANPKLMGRSIGVVTLHGTAQAAHIHELVGATIPTIDIVERKIAVGPPTVFQGRERDIMMVSMVLDHASRAAQNKSEMYQRFNVALSRARDRMYLFRSVQDTAFGEDTMNARLMKHFKKPFSQDQNLNQSRRDQCESGFEREVFDELVKRGFRVQPQVKCGGYRIDMVVEGNDGRRLAIECDGDKFHGPGQWSNDMIRQRVLERAGWVFWRCFASSFMLRRESVVGDLLASLAQSGIEPLGDDNVDSSTWVEYREADPLGVDAPETAPEAVEAQA